MFSSAKPLDKVEVIHKRALRFLNSDYTPPFEILFILLK